jgi:peptide/nickel transport system substrate-binding protein
VPSRNVLTIGVPEGSVGGTELGLGQLISTFTLEGLTQVNFGLDGRARPKLAESWAWENANLRLRVRLRQDVFFHDGTKLTADVAAEALSRAIAQPGNKALYPSLTAIQAVRPESEFELVIDLSERSAFLPEELDLPLGIGPNNAGTGAFRLVQRTDEGAQLEKFDKYYLTPGNVDEIVIKPFDTLRTAWTRLLRGEVDMVTDVPPEALEFVRNDDIQILSYARTYQFLVAFNATHGALKIPAVRRALNTAIDRQVLITKVLQGEGQPATGPIWPKHWAYDTTVSPYAFDPHYASMLLDSSGFAKKTQASADSPPARFRFTCLLPAGFSLLERIGLEIQKQLYDVGVDMQFEVVPIQEYDSRIREGRFDAVLVDLISGPTFGRPFIFWRTRAHFTGLNVFGYENPETERLFDVLLNSTNEAAIRSATSRLERAFLDDPPALFLAWDQRARAVNRRFQVTQSPRDPLFTIWQWTENTDRRTVSTQ